MLDVICFGEILWDLFEARPRGREPIARTFRRELGGAPANVATGLARLGVRVAIVGGVGRDRLGQGLLAQLERDGVDVSFVKRLPHGTGVVFVLRDALGEPEFLFYRQGTADMAIRSTDVQSKMGRAHWMVMGTSTLVTSTLAGATERWLAAGRRAGAELFVDLNVRPHMWPNPATMRSTILALASRAALVKASEADLQALGPRHRSLAWLERVAPQATWLVTRGAGQASAIGAHGEVHVAALPARCIDATGGGDAFIAGSLATLLRARALPGSPTWSDPTVWRTALRVGHMMGKKAVSRAGAVAGLIQLGRVRASLGAVQRRFA